ncbi:MAG TPA: MauE/DoxX family redox-associated membrane protein [Candidatus Eremiobacteraceae bacterium]
MKYSLGRYLYGLAAIGFGICALVSNDSNNWQQEVKALGDFPHREILSYIVATVEIIGGAAILWPRTARAGAAAVGTLYFIFALLGIPFIIRHPLIYNEYGNFFEQFSFVSGAAILYACSGLVAPTRTSRLAQIGYYSFGVCVLSFALEQLFYLANTASLVPKWIPPGQMFWAVATTVAFALAAIALLTGFKARLASRLNTAMLVVFGLLVWLPALFADPHSFENWSESVETLGIAGSAWIVAEFLSRRHSTEAVEI